MYQKNVKKNISIEEGRRHYVLIKDFNTFLYDHTLHLEENILVAIAYKLLVR